MMVPATFPWSAFSTVSLCTRLTSSAPTEATSFARFRRAIVVAWPVTTCSLSCSAVAFSLISTSLSLAATGTDADW